MSQYPPPLPSQPPTQPSIVGPILLTAVGASAMFVLPAVMGNDVSACCFQNCGAAIMAAALGMMPVILLRRSGGHPTSGMGCLVGFFGVAIGGLVGAIVQASFPPYDEAQLREMLDQVYTEMAQQWEKQGQPAPASREETVSNGVAMAPYFVIMVATFSSILAGLVGMLVAALGGRRPPPQQPPWPQQPWQQQPGQQQQPPQV